MTKAKKRQLKGYLCGGDHGDLSLGAIAVVIFSSIKALKANRTCWRECGIVEIDLKPKTKVKGTL